MLRPLPLASWLALIVGIAACQPSPPPEFRIGLIGTFEGNFAQSSGLPARQGATLAVDALNEEGGVLIDGVRHRVVLIDRETAPRPDAASTVARGLINLDSVDVLIGPQQSVLALAAGAVAEASDVPMIAPMASSPAVTAGRRLVSRLAFLDAVQGRVLARFAYDSLGARRAAVLYAASSAYGREIATLFRTTFEATGARMVGEETFNADDPETVTPQLRRLLAASPDVLLLPNFTSRDSLHFQLARSLGFSGRLLGSDAWDAIALSRRPEVQGAIIVANWDRRTDTPAVRALRTRYAAQYGNEPMRATAAATYDAVQLVAEAARRAGARTGAIVMDSLRHLGAYDGAFGSYRFVGTGDPVRGAVLLEVAADSTGVRAVVAPPQ